MDRMTTSGSQTAERGRGFWMAFLLPLLAAQTLHPGGGLAPWVLVLFTAALALASPKVAAKLVPFACLACGGYGFYLAHYVQNWAMNPLIYGLVRVGTADNAGWLVPEALAFTAVGVWLLALTGAPGGRAVRRAFWQLRGSHDQPKTVPPLLLLAVIFLWEELFCSDLWFPLFSSSGQRTQVVALGILAIGVGMVVWRPQAAAVTAVAGTVLFGLVGVLWTLHWFTEANGPIGNGAIFYGAVPVHSFAPDTIAGLIPATQGSPALQVLAGAQGLALAAFGVMLVPRLVTWSGDLELANRARALTQRVTRLTETRSDANEVAVAELRRIERDLHDGAQARLVAVGMSLRAAEQLMRANPEAAQALVAEARETSSRALDDLRSLVRGIYPPVLADRGLGDAVRALALDAPLTVNTDITLDEQEPPLPVAAAVYFAIAEALTNAVRHAEADTVEIGIGYCDEVLRATITDDGIGGADPSRGTGLLGVERRLATFDGIMALTSPVGGPTIVVLEVPCAPAGGPAWPGDHTWADVVRSSWQTRTLI
jgi:signal transduction histidine kinase